MGTTTSKGLYKYDTEGERVDVAKINENFDRLNLLGMGAYVCTSTTQPTGADRWPGQVIYETDTLAFAIYDGINSKWRHFDTKSQDWNPVFENFTKGTSTVVGRQFRQGTRVTYTLNVVLPATGFSFNSSDVRIVIPSSLYIPNSSVVVGRATVVDAGVGWTYSDVRWDSATRVLLWGVKSSSIGWGIDDSFAASFTVELA